MDPGVGLAEAIGGGRRQRRVRTGRDTGGPDLLDERNSRRCVAVGDRTELHGPARRDLPPRRRRGGLRHDRGRPERELRRRWGLLRRSSLGARVATPRSTGTRSCTKFSAPACPSPGCSTSGRAFRTWRPTIPSTSPSRRFFTRSVTGGCPGRRLLPGRSSVTRAQMAVLLLKSKLGSAHIPPPCTGTVFADVPCTGGPFDPWVEELAAPPDHRRLRPYELLSRRHRHPPADGCISAQSLRRLGLRSRPHARDSSTTLRVRRAPASPTGSRSSPTAASPAAARSEPPPYCPTNPNNRGQMAVFLVKTFGLALYGG